MRKLLTIVVLTFFTLTLSANDGASQEVILDNVVVVRKNTTFTIIYDLSFAGEDVHSCDIALMLSTDGGETFGKVDKRKLSGDVGRITTAGPKSIVYDFEKDKALLAGKSLVFKVEVIGKGDGKSHFLLTGQMAVYPHLSYGIMVGTVNKWGWYAKLRSDFCFPTSSYEWTSTSGGFWGTGGNQISRYAVTVGTLARACKWLYPYVGLGYGSYGLYWQDARRDWAVVSDYFTRGLSVDAGVVLKLGKLSVTAGASNTMFRYTEAEIGVGFMF